MARRRGGTGLSLVADEARQQILGAAEQVILRYGVDKTTMDDIGRAVGVSRPTVYRYFGDRDALLGALIERRARMLFERARIFIASHDTFAEQLVEGLIYLVDHGRRDPIVRILVSPEHVELAGGVGLAAALTGEMWAPILQAAAERGEIRDDLAMTDITEWLALVQLILVGRLDFSRVDDPGHRTLLRSFVLPAFLPAGVSAPAV
ncbi:TetR/AcrR family transcriptional regulator [Mycolicibacterium sphagni]|uniref:TetR family transcriptional regulator n=1 Tax=Mycolicibacterium sphagni TaxID=1786 RepID=A0A255D9Z3_9MYCO|nr:TetR/AcrR family transcriptional regulator [Mycolicibacterium sphagni]OYN76186.1 TetR family transcriptional regulator [Mycolicibacterium sphagni]